MATLASFLAQRYHSYILELQSAVRAMLSSPEDPENLHKVRTTVRRIRTLLKAFKKEFDPRFFQRAKKFFKEIMEQTTQARDIDVFLENFKGYKSSLPPSMQEWIEPLHSLLIQKREQEYEKLQTFFESSRLKEELWRLSYPLVRQSDVKAKKGIKRAIKATKKELKHQQDLHAVRIVYKRLRYLTELLADFENVKKEIRRLKKIQDLLGRYHDLVVQKENIYHFATSSDLNKEGLLAAGKLMGDLEGRAKKLEKKATKRLLITR